MAIMDSAQFSEPKAALLERAQKAGFDISAVQLVNWHRAGLLPKPWQKRLGRARGTETVYPKGTGDKLLTLCRLHRKRRNLRELGWRLWWLGYPVESRCWLGYLKSAGQRMDRGLDRVRRGYAMLHSTDTSTSQKACAELSMVARTKRLRDPHLAQLRKRAKPGNFDAVLRFILGFASGNLRDFVGPTDGGTPKRERRRRTVESAMGFPVESTDQAAKISDQASGGIWATWQQAAPTMVGQSFADTVARASVADLERARAEFCGIADAIAALTQHQSEVSGNKPHAQDTLHDPFEDADAFVLAVMFIAWFRVRTAGWVKPYGEIVSGLTGVSMESHEDRAHAADKRE